MYAFIARMTGQLWQGVRGFSKGEKWGDPMMMACDIVFALEEFRGILRKKYSGASISVHCGYDTDGHATDSMHYQGLAVDFHVIGVPLLEVVRLAIESGLFDGVGCYPNWKSPGVHVDKRNLAQKADVYWIERKETKGTGQYDYFHDRAAYLAAVEQAIKEAA